MNNKLSAFLIVIGLVAVAFLVRADVELSQKQYNNCDRLTLIVNDVQLWRRNNKEASYEDFVVSEKNTSSITQMIAYKLYTEVPVHVPPVAVGIDFQGYCLGAYETMNKELTES